MHPTLAVLAACVVALAASCQTPTRPQTVPTDTKPTGSLAGTQPATPFPEGLPWLNTDRPYKLEDFRGKVVLLDFWTYCCINCIHVVPDLHRLEQEFPELVVVGVHSAKFLNEQDQENIRSAVLRYDLAHPVLVDNEFILWRKYGIQAWPSFVVIDPAGNYVGSASGEGVYDRLKPYVSQLSEEFGQKGLLNRERLTFALEKNRKPGGVLAYPGKVVADEKTQRLFITDANHNRILITSSAGQILEVIGSGTAGKADGSYTQAQFFRPQGLALNASKNLLYVADTDNHLVREVNLSTRAVRTVLGTGRQAQYKEAERGTGPQVPINSPWDVTLSADGQTLHIAMAGPHQLWQLDTRTLAAQVQAGSGREDIIDGPAAQAALAQPSGLVRVGQTLYFADSEVSALRKLEDGQVKTLIGEGLFEFGDVDGLYPKARLQHPLGVAERNGMIYLADTYNHKIKTYNPTTGELKTLLGTGQRGLTDGKPATVQFNEPNGLAWLGGKLYITDTNNDQVRVYDPATGWVSTLPVGQAGPAPTAGEDLPPLGMPVRLAPVALAPGGMLELSITVPAGYHLNEEAPNRVALSGSRQPLEATVSAQGMVLRVPTKSLKNGALVLEAAIYYCQDGKDAQCLIQNLVITQPLTAGGAATAVATYPLEVKAKP